ncbi:hypothetical protein EYC80_001828 [Monilinia laxa]|uniref:Uncharacterized protein n=1 Tax=Monilinia laxa TaxID=61186 RepID=A0A5N6K658_MONLA|nr:hypothetical protein EYC80_001828 [Monilinia laxa]
MISALPGCWPRKKPPSGPSFNSLSKSPKTFLTAGPSNLFPIGPTPFAIALKSSMSMKFTACPRLVRLMLVSISSRTQSPSRRPKASAVSKVRIK